MFELSWAHPVFFYCLPLALLPWLFQNTTKKIAWQGFIPKDSLSGVLFVLSKLAASVAMTCLILTLADPYIPEQIVERTRQGAEFVILLDRSRSMDDQFARPPRNTLQRYTGVKHSKREVSRDYLTEFVKRRPDDRFGYVFFSTKATEILKLTYNKDAVLATINAGGLGRGISQTDIFKALSLAVNMYKDEPYRGSRNILLISDGGQILSTEQKQYLQDVFKKMRLNLYWIYLRSMRGMTLDPSDNDNLLWIDMPERKLHKAFKTLGVPYQAFEAGSLDEFAQAIDEIHKQQSQPLIVEERVPKQHHHDLFLWLALLSLFPLMLSRVITVWGVKRAAHKH